VLDRNCPRLNIKAIMDELTALRVFALVVEERSFSGAARKSNLSVSSISRLVSALEEELGVRLLNRSTRHLGLTEAGELYHESARKIVHDIDAAKRLVSSYQDKTKGNIRVHARKSAGAQVIAPALKDFLVKYPEVSIDLTLTDERVDLVAEGVDIAVWLGNLEDSSLIARRLSSSRRLVCGSPGYFDERGIPRTPDDLSKHNCILYRANQYTTSWRFQHGSEVVTVPVRGNLQTASASALLTSALAGLGLVVLQEWMVRSTLAEGKLVSVLTEYDVSPTDFDTALYAVYPHSRGLSPKVRAFIDFLVALFPRE
jgi:DNA-binding transcriptional LysR family regulator